MKPQSDTKKAFSLLRALIDEADVDYVRDMYVAPHEGCVPEPYGDHDLSGAIVDKFYHWYRAVADVVARDAGIRRLDLSVIVQPSWEDTSAVVVMYSRRIVLMYEWMKAWRFGGLGSVAAVLKRLQRDYEYLSGELENAVREYPNPRPTLVYNS
jgi:hypothetical protein